MPGVARPRFFPTPAAFRRWLERYGARAPHLLVGFHKAHTGKRSMTWSESVDVALCFGWIDGVRKSLGGGAYTIRFSPRRPGSIWSAINIAKAKALGKEGRMTAAGLAAFATRTARKSVVYAYEQRGIAVLTPAERRLFKSHAAAWTHFERTPPGYRKVVMHWVTTAKRPETRERRLARLVRASSEGKRLLEEAPLLQRTLRGGSSLLDRATLKCREPVRSERSPPCNSISPNTKPSF